MGDDNQGSTMDNYKQEHPRHNHKFEETNQQNKETALEQNFILRILKYIANTLIQEIPRKKTSGRI